MFPCRDQVVVVYVLLLMGLRVCVPVESHTDSAVQCSVCLRAWIIFIVVALQTILLQNNAITNLIMHSQVSVRQCQAVACDAKAR